MIPAAIATHCDPYPQAPYFQWGLFNLIAGQKGGMDHKITGNKSYHYFSDQ
jgi:hypothetical protein